MKRRQIFGGLAAAMVPFGFASAQVVTGAPPLTLLVAGPEGDRTSRWGNACALAMAGSFPGDPVIRTQAVGGLDGVTGANQLDTLVVPDGRTAAILPGAALIAWLTGDSRVHFDPTRWVPLMVGCNSGVLVVRLPKGAAPDLQTLRAMAPLRLAADQPESNDLAALLALARMGVPMAPVFGLRDSDGQDQCVSLRRGGCGVSGRRRRAGGHGAADRGRRCAGVLSRRPRRRMARSPAIRCSPACRMCTASAAATRRFSMRAFRAAAVAARTDFLLVLPRLSDPNKVAEWGQAANAAIASPGLAAAASASSITLQAAPVAQASLAVLAQVGAGQAELQGFLAKNFGWQPS